DQTELVASFNTNDRDRLQPIWDSFYQEVVTDKVLTLDPTPINTLGGVIISNKAKTIRFDNTFEGREERLANPLHQTILERLFPAGTVQDNLSSMR
ncbi:MAG: V-type ATP synthase subunit E family protein, partial [Sedimenticola sp.]|nr:V-type ATP synthase subunit E family protein [Sedimenticola sp.]